MYVSIHLWAYIGYIGYINNSLKPTVRVDNHLPILDLSLNSYTVDPGRPDAYIVSDNLIVL